METIILDIPSTWTWTDDELYDFCLANRDKMIDPENYQTWIYRANGSISLVSGFDQILSGENVLEGFEFDLRLLL